MDHGIAGKAHGLVYGERAKSYGHPRKDFRIIGQVWTGLLQDLLKDGAQLDEYRVAVLMTGLKLARLVHAPEHHDSRVDTIGYMLTMERLDEPEETRPETMLQPVDFADDEPPVQVRPGQTYVFPVVPASRTAQAYHDVRIQADSYSDAKQAFDAMQIYSQPVYPKPCEDNVTPAASEDKLTGPVVSVPFEPGPREQAMLREVTSQYANPSDDEVALAKSILDRRAAFHDREAAMLLVRGDGIGLGPE